LDEIIDFSELGDFLDIPVRTYSSGMQLRLAFSVSTVIRPEILLMDEWLSVGDERFRQKAEARLFDLIQSTKILVIASHSKELIIKNCNRVIWLEHGIMKMDGPPDLICEKYFN
jgi:lipopolysaccharide transport system ATP-binding protein